ncbi:putative deoxyribonuclease RhsC [compost metagenome]
MKGRGRLFDNFLRMLSGGLLLVTCVLPACALAADEVEKRWYAYEPAGHDAERGAQVEIEAVFKGFQVFGSFGFEVASQSVVGEKLVSHYTIKPGPLTTTEWRYFYNGEVPDVSAAIAALVARNRAENPDCVVEPGTLQEWSGWAPGPDGNFRDEEARVPLTLYCAVDEPPSQTYDTVSRSRDIYCPNSLVMEWSESQQRCVGASVFGNYAYWTTALPEQCDNVGNPCDPTTGDKLETEVDLDAGWIRFSRHYHSSSSIARGPFGHNWTHSHNVHLSVGPDLSVYPPVSDIHIGLINGDGTHVAFEQVGQIYEAVDGSGDRAVQQAGQWVVHREDEVLRFNANGQLLARLFDDGTSLAYSYDGFSRLASITHSTGRRIELAYLSEFDDRVAGLSINGRPYVVYLYGSNEQLTLVDYVDGGDRIYHYENAQFPSHLTGVTAEDGGRYSWVAYDSKGRVICSQHGAACDSQSVGIDGVLLSYAADGTTTVTDALGKQAIYQLSSTASGLGRKVTGLTDSQGTISRAYYDRSVDFRRRLDTYTDRRGIQTKHAYAESTDPVSGRAVNIHTMTEAVGLPEQRVVTTTRDVETNAVLATRVGKRETRATYNARRQPTAITVSDIDSGHTRTTLYSYCEAADLVAAGSCPVEGLLKGVDGPRTDVADTVTYAYYPADDAGCPTGGGCTYRKGDLRSVTNALGQTVETLAYDAFGRPLSLKDANGVVTDYTYHPRGWPTSVTVRGATTAEDRSTQISYWPTGQVQQITEPDGGSVTYVYDAALRLTDIEDNAGNTIHYTLDNAGNRLKEDTLDAGGTLRRTLARTFNTIGQLTALKDAGNHATGFTYDANGNPQTVTDALQRVSSQQYDPLNRLARTLQDVDGVAAEIRSQYNALDQVTQVTDPKGLHTTYAYNGFGDLTGQVSPDSGASSFTVDAAGNRKTATDARGITATYHYDALNRLTGIAYPDPNLDVGYSYDGVPAACAADERFAKGRLGQVLHANGSTQYCHDRFGQITRKVQTVNGVASTLRYAYSKSGRLTVLTYPDGSVADYVRDTQGRISEIGLTRHGQSRQIVVNNVTYAAFGPATGWTYGNGRQLQRPLDLDYRPQALHDPAAGGLSLGYGYDPVGSITELKNGAGSEVLAKYAYDALGRLTQTQDGATGTPIETYGYDATGNRTSLTTSAGTANYTYLATSHRLTVVDGEPRNHDAAGNTTSIGSKMFTYNDANRMNAVKQGNATLESYGYNHRGERVLRTPAGGAAQITLYDEAGQWLGNYSATGQAQQQAIWLDYYPVALINLPSSGVPELAYVQPDHLGTPRVVIDSARDVAIWEWSNKSEAFGDQAPANDPDGDGVAFELSLRFPGQQATDASGLFYNNQREYDPRVGRYSQSDPLGLSAGISSYGYAEANSLSLSDPYGLQVVGSPREMMNPTTEEQARFVLPLLADITPVLGDLRAFGEFCESPTAGNFAILASGALGPIGKISSKVGRSGIRAVSAARKSSDVIHVTKSGVALPAGGKHAIPSHYIQNPRRPGSFGEMVGGKYQERLRIDPATPPGTKGPNYSHYHLDQRREHFSPAPGDRDPGF